MGFGERRKRRGMGRASLGGLRLDSIEGAVFARKGIVSIVIDPLQCCDMKIQYRRYKPMRRRGERCRYGRNF
jgi:hypothetical protein